MQENGDAFGKKVVIFHVAGGRFGFFLEWVHGVLNGFADEAGSEPGGRIDYRGRKVPVVDLAEWFDATPARQERRSLLVVGKEGRMAAAGVESPVKVVTAGRMEEWPSLVRPLVEGTFTGLMTGKERLVLMVDPEGVIEEVGREVGLSPKEAEGNDQKIVG